MIKAVTTRSTKRGTIRKMGAEVEIDGTKLELLHEFMGILDSLEESCPDVILKALQLHMEDKNYDN
ncbi:MAG: hypothetical protein IIT65_13220 [Lachnospiraceae bacterium]|nr:hypothetical protein [Lachnospiraceae bacterium]